MRNLSLAIALAVACSTPGFAAPSGGKATSSGDVRISSPATAVQVTPRKPTGSSSTIRPVHRDTVIPQVAAPAQSSSQPSQSVPTPALAAPSVAPNVKPTTSHVVSPGIPRHRPNLEAVREVFSPRGPGDAAGGGVSDLFIPDAGGGPDLLDPRWDRIRDGAQRIIEDAGAAPLPEGIDPGNLPGGIDQEGDLIRRSDPGRSHEDVADDYYSGALDEGTKTKVENWGSSVGPLSGTVHFEGETTSDPDYDYDGDDDGGIDTGDADADVDDVADGDEPPDDDEVDMDFTDPVDPPPEDARVQAMSGAGGGDGSSGGGGSTPQKDDGDDGWERHRRSISGGGRDDGIRGGGPACGGGGGTALNIDESTTMSPPVGPDGGGGGDGSGGGSGGGGPEYMSGSAQMPSTSSVASPTPDGGGPDDPNDPDGPPNPVM
ncbi:MAG: hypothetical protein HN341_15085 [Verrucomicrobia bacterium]|nr:hypothetical protein [Verrucomicrobiota bacterium]